VAKWQANIEKDESTPFSTTKINMFAGEKSEQEQNVTLPVPPHSEVHCSRYELHSCRSGRKPSHKL
jgi:hypothetical protein